MWKLSWVLALSVGLVIATGFEKSAQAQATWTDCDPSKFPATQDAILGGFASASTSANSPQKRRGSFVGKCIKPVGFKVAGNAGKTGVSCDLVDSDPKNSCAFSKLVNLASSNQNFNSLASVISGQMNGAPTAPINKWLQRYSAQICNGGTPKVKAGSTRYQNAFQILSEREVPSGNTCDKLCGGSSCSNIQATTQTRITKAFDSFKRWHEGVNKALNDMLTEDGVGVQAHANRAWCPDAAGDWNAKKTQATTRISSRCSNSSVARGFTQTAWPSPQNWIQAVKHYTIPPDPCVANAGALIPDNNNTLAAGDFDFTKFETCLKDRGYGSPSIGKRPLTPDDVISITIYASASTLNNTNTGPGPKDIASAPNCRSGGDCNARTNYCLKGFYGLANDRAQSAIEVLKTYMTSGLFITQTDFDALKSNKIKVSAGGKRSDGSSGDCAYKISGAPTDPAGILTFVQNNTKFTEVRDSADATDQELDEAQYVKISMNVKDASVATFQSKTSESVLEVFTPSCYKLPSLCCVGDAGC